MEDDDDALDTVRVEKIRVDTPAGPIQQQILVPVRLDSFSAQNDNEDNHASKVPPESGDNAAAEWAKPDTPIKHKTPEDVELKQAHIWDSLC